MNPVDKVRIGMSRDEIVALLGVPDDIGGTSRKSKIPCIYKYGNVEFHFGATQSGKLVLAYTEDDEGNGIVLLESS
jgi:hypothetical protein